MKERDESGTTLTIDRRGVNAYRALRDLAGEILASDDVENALNRCGALVQELLQADACSVALLDQRAGALVPLLTMASGRSADIPPLSLQMLDGRLLKAIKESRPLIVAHGAIIDGDIPLPLSEAQSALTAMLLPLPVRGKVGYSHATSLSATESPFTRMSRRVGSRLPHQIFPVALPVDVGGP